MGEGGVFSFTYGNTRKRILHASFIVTRDNSSLLKSNVRECNNHDTIAHCIVYIFFSFTVLKIRFQYIRYIHWVPNCGADPPNAPSTEVPGPNWLHCWASCGVDTTADFGASVSALTPFLSLVMSRPVLSGSGI